MAAKAVSQGGAPLTRAQRGYFEPRFGRDLSAIRVHTDHEAMSAAERIDARAYTLGSDIAFARGEYRPDTDSGRLLIAHELAHTLQQARGDAPAIRRAPEDAPKDKPPDVPVTLAAKDLLVYPLFIDLWSDIFTQKLTEKQKQEFKLKGTESAAIWNLIFAGGFAGKSLNATSTFGDFLEAWVKNAKEIHRIAGSEKFYLDFFSRFVGINLDSYLGSELFKSRLKTHAASLATLLVAAQIGLSTVMAVKKPSAKPGELEATGLEKHTLLVSTLFSVILAEQIKAPDFFNIGPLKLATHPAFAASSPVAGGPPPELVFEHKKGKEEGELLKAGLTLNLPQIVALFQKDAPPAKEIADLQKNRGLQTSLWLSYDKFDPTALQRESGKLPSKSLHGGLLVGGNGVLVQLENGVRYTGDDAKTLTGLFVRGGFGYAGKKGEVIQKLGFTATYTEWTEKDIYAPRIGAGGEAVAGNAGHFSPVRQDRIRLSAQIRRRRCAWLRHRHRPGLQSLRFPWRSFLYLPGRSIGRSTADLQARPLGHLRQARLVRARFAGAYRPPGAGQHRSVLLCRADQHRRRKDFRPARGADRREAVRYAEGPGADRRGLHCRQEVLGRRAMRSAQALQQRSFQNVTGSPSRQHFIQTKLRIGSHDDPLEREADRIAAAVVGETKVPAIGAGPPNVAQRKCAQCEAEETPVLRKAASTAATSGGAARAASALAQGGVPLTPEQRAYFEPRFGRDFSEVRVHADGSAAEAARAINAHAYTLGRDIAFAEGQFRPGSQEGKRLIAHELAHVIHQADSPRPDATVRRQPTERHEANQPFQAP